MYLLLSLTVQVHQHILRILFHYKKLLPVPDQKSYVETGLELLD